MASGTGRGWRSSSDSLPRTQRGTTTSSPRTFSKPSFFISAITQSMAASRFVLPLKRGPNVSHRYARRRKAKSSLVDAEINCRAAGPYRPEMSDGLKSAAPAEMTVNSARQDQVAR
jgi:hypothetical protein